MTRGPWTHAQFDEMSWHDNHVHAMRIVEGEYGAGTLVLDLDYILQWVQGPEGVQFLVMPVSLCFTEVTNLRIALDYSTASAALGPFSIHAIERHTEARERYIAQVWKVLVNWPVGDIAFEASGYEQRSEGDAVLTPRQHLLPSERYRA
jgi:hypothetical protein